MANHIYKAVKKRLNYKKELKILDFGGGGGDISKKLCSKLLKNNFAQGIVLDVIDPSGVQSEFVIAETIINFFYDLENLKSKKYDIVIASAVLEHIPELKSVLSKLLGFMDKNSLLYIRTPYIVPLTKFLFFFRINFVFNFPDHLYDMGSDFWDNVFERIFPDMRSEYNIIISRPSPVESSIKKNFTKTLLSYLFKFPYIIFGKQYKLVGGWETVIEKT